MSLWIELRPNPLVPHPFLSHDVDAGQPVDDSVVWRQIPDGILVAHDGLGIASHALSSGDPILASDTTSQSFVPPPDWWIVELTIPTDAEPGSRVQLVIVPEPGSDPQNPIAGVVVTVTTEDVLGGGRAVGSVAVSAADAASAAVAIANDRVSVLIQHPG